ncbi:MAG: hypothetical protein LUQ54_06930 [Methanoregula sp.]|nr:hypothetical protein [Methanoregula sp.]
MTPLFNDTFAEWTHGLDIRESMISIFTHIRDIPYSLTAPVPDPETSLQQLLIKGKGSCGPKHYLLAEMFRKLNVSVLYTTIAFSWNDPDLCYPPALRKQAELLPVAHHLACRVQVGCRWSLVDATWDSPLAKAGFPVNHHWDGYSDLRCAVKPLTSPVQNTPDNTRINVQYRGKDDDELSLTPGEKNHWSATDRARYYRKKMAAHTMDEVERITRFNHDFNAWLDCVRQQ